MKTRQSNLSAFSLIEVSAALGIISVGLISLMALVPMGLANTRACKSETHAAELARAVFSTMASESFKQTYCFSPGDESSLDLSLLSNYDSSAEPVVLYASYDVRRTEPEITRRDTLPKQMETDGEVYKIELRNQPQAFSKDDQTVVGSHVKIAIYQGRERTPIFRGSSYLGLYGKAGLLEQKLSSGAITANK